MPRLAPPPTRERRRVAVTGIVQGVGFRPFVYRLATARGLAGWARNTGGGVEIEVEGEPAALDAFAAALVESAPPLARIEAVRSSPLGARGGAGFRILPSRPSRGAPLPVGPDAATCPACLAEVRDPDARRAGYAFTNCTDCGPRFTIIGDLPYDRARTTLASFPLCSACRSEYEDPADRRFHAEPIACPACGPHLRYFPAGGDPLTAAAAALVAGRTVAIKGLGGYQLACDATRSAPVRRLRERKGRDAKPFALMVRDLAAARRLCRVDDLEAELLSGRRAPIVLLERREPSPSDAQMPRVVEEVAPGLQRLGVMLPCTPLHHLLMARVDGPLVLTSGNRSGEPIAAHEEEARARLAGVADAFLTHDRPIASRYDDSVVRVDGGASVVLRRARGYAPEPLRLPLTARRSGLAVGAQLKSTFCLVRGTHAFQSQHIGDLDDAATAAHFAETVSLYRRLFRVDPAWVAHDLHPDYASTRFAEALPEEVTRVAVQHHHAHVVSCLAEHGRTTAALGVCFDGAGYGPDGTTWGGELLLADGRSYRRLAHLRHLPMPGGDAAAREPWRMAVAALGEALGEGAEATVETLLGRVAPGRRRPVLQMALRRVNAPLTSSAGRLFDAVAALAGLRDVNRYEGHAAMELETRVDAVETGAYPLPLRNGVWDSVELILAAAEDVRAGIAPGRVSARFHTALARAAADGCRRAREETGVATVVLTGGCFQNRWLAGRTRALLEDAGFEVLTHRQVPPNDGGISLGQAAVAVALQNDI